MDMKIDPGNIATYLSDEQCIECINGILNESEITKGTFSVGYDFKYWPYYKDDNNYIDKKYENFKEEILNYQHLNIRSYVKEIIPKATVFMKTKLVKSLEAKGYETLERYGITHGAGISTDILMSIILYTDYTELSSNFTGTFRKKNIYEPIQSVKQRNKEYYWFSRRLKECILCFGQSNYSGNGHLSVLSSPLYCGMSYILMMPSFNMVLFGPTSTTCHLEVATLFSGEGGIILQFDNTKGQARITKGMDVSWLSRYGGQEDER